MDISGKNNLVAGISIIFAVIASDLHAQKAYVGVDIGQQYSGFKKGYGQEVFANKSPFIEVQLGKIFKDNWGIEVGTSITTDKKQNRRLVGATDALPGDVLTPGFNHTTQSETQTRNFYVGLIGSYPLDQKFTLFGLAGISHIWMRDEYKPIILNNVLLSLGDQAAATRTFKTHGNTIILRLGAKYSITERFGIKAAVTWENTKKFKTKSNQSSNLADLVKHKNTAKIGIGFYLHD